MKTFILFWNPSISNYKGEGRKELIDAMKEGYDYHATWAVWDWQNAHKGDRFFKVLCGSKDVAENGIIESGYFASEPYVDEDWSGKGREVHYCELEYDSLIDYKHMRTLTATELADAIPYFDWKGGHSGRLLDETDAEKLEELWSVYLAREDVRGKNSTYVYLNEEFRPHEDFFHVFRTNGMNWDEVMQEARKTLSTGEQDYTIMETVFDTTDGDVEELEMAYVKGISAQGVILMKMKEGVTHVQLPWMASMGDIQLCIAILRAIKKLHPECAILANQDQEETSLTDEKLAELMALRIQNMITLLETDDMAMGIEGVRHPYYVLSEVVQQMGELEGMSIDETAVQLMEALCKSQWEYEDYEEPGRMEITDPTGEEYVARTLANTGRVFVRNSDKLCLLVSKKQIKIVDRHDFMMAALETKYCEMVDMVQFVLKKMPAKEWSKLVNSLEGQMMEGGEDGKA